VRYVFTALAGDIDALQPPGRVPPGWRCVCFSNTHSHPEWETRPLPDLGLDDRRRTRHVKLLADHHLPDAELSLWMDANIASACDLEGLVGTYLGERDVAFHPHPDRDCIYDEAVACIEFGKASTEKVVDQVVEYALRGYPRHNGLVAGGVILRRHTPAVAEFNARWWAELSTHTPRDQLAANVVLHELGLGYALFDSSIRDGPLFEKREHAVRDFEPRPAIS
jgi:hypothetical protein